MNGLLYRILLWNLTACLEQLFHRTLHNGCFCLLISLRTTLSMIYINKKTFRYTFSRLFVVLALRSTYTLLYVMDFNLFIAESKLQFATHGKWRLKFGNRLLINYERMVHFRLEWTCAFSSENKYKRIFMWFN